MQHMGPVFATKCQPLSPLSGTLVSLPSTPAFLSGTLSKFHPPPLLGWMLLGGILYTLGPIKCLGRVDFLYNA